MKEQFLSYLHSGIVLMDGAFGTMAQAAGLSAGIPTEQLNRTAPDLVRRVHRQYIRAGARTVYGNTFGLPRAVLAKEEGASELMCLAYTHVRAAAEAEGVPVFAVCSLSPTAELMQPMGSMTFDKAYALYAALCEDAQRVGFDAVVFETFADLSELKAAVLAAKDRTGLPVLATVGVRADGRTFLGSPLSAFALTADGLGVDALGVNCCPLLQTPGFVRTLRQYTDKPVIVRANAGLPDASGGYTETPEQFAKTYAQCAGAGATVFGGCCGTRPDTIAALKSLRAAAHVKRDKAAASVASAYGTVPLLPVTLAGERLNPTNFPEYAAALKDGDASFAAELALEQVSQGAALIDVNVGAPLLDASAAFRLVLPEIQTLCHAPLMIDTADPAAADAALCLCAGRPVLNSVPCGGVGMDAMLSVVRRHGAAIVLMALKDGKPCQTADDMTALVLESVQGAERYGIPAERILADVCVLPEYAAAGRNAEVLKAVKRLTGHGIMTLLGISNISYGLPDRPQRNAAFYRQCKACGLTVGIVHPEHITGV